MYTIGGKLYHHGVLGMKWGQRNGPPYPLSPGAHSASEKKAGYKKSIGGGRNESEYDRKKIKKKKVDASKQGSVVSSAANKAYDVAKNKQKKNQKTYAKMDIPDSDSAVTKRVKNDFNTLSNEEFFAKYKASKDTYEKRVKKYGDPYMNSPLAKWAKKQNAKKRAKYDKQIDKLKKDVDSYEPIKEGLKDKKGKDILTKDDVSSMRKALNDRIDKLEKKKKIYADEQGSVVSSAANKAYDVAKNKQKKNQKTYAKMDIPDSDSAVTKRVKNDFNTLSNEEFFAKYKASKDTYEKRVKKYGDPYMNSPLAKWAKKHNAKKRKINE